MANDTKMLQAMQPKKGAALFWLRFWKNRELHLMMLLPLIYIIIFEFGPMYGLQIAFRDYRPRKGIWASEWVWFEHFEEFFKNKLWSTYVLNTARISLYTIVASFPMPIFLALVIHINERAKLKKITQNISYMPHFFSTVIMVGILNQVFSPVGGIYPQIVKMLGVDRITDLRSDPDAFIHMYVWSGIWQGTGWSAILYVAALSGVSTELHEAAKLDGASRWQRVIHVDIPAILPTICMQLILRCGSILSVGYEKVYLMQYPQNKDVSEVISTYVYKAGIGQGDLSFGTAVGLMNTVINTSLVLLVNWITDKLSDGENSLF